MKIGITGHTYGLGKALYNYYSHNHDVIGFSRTNGYSLPQDLDKVIEESKGLDLFINNAYLNGLQVDLFRELVDHVDKMVIMGSVARFYQDIIPKKSAKDKYHLFEEIRLYCLNPSAIPCLHLDISFLEQQDKDYADPNKIKGDVLITYEEICNTIDFWLKHPKIRNVEFVTKLTNNVQNEIDRVAFNFTKNS